MGQLLKLSGGGNFLTHPIVVQNVNSNKSGIVSMCRCVSFFCMYNSVSGLLAVLLSNK